VESLRLTGRSEEQDEIAVAAADPMNLAGVVVPGTRIPAVPGRSLRFRNGTVIDDERPEPALARVARVSAALLNQNEAVPCAAQSVEESLSLF
jgi:ATP-dependent Lhr-like helicase